MALIRTGGSAKAAISGLTFIRREELDAVGVSFNLQAGKTYIISTYQAEAGIGVNVVSGGTMIYADNYNYSTPQGYVLEATSNTVVLAMNSGFSRVTVSIYEVEF